MAYKVIEMAYVFHSAHNLGAPFLLVDEVVMIIPKGDTLRLRQHHFKILFILDGSIEHEIEGLEGRQTLKAGDLLVAPVVARHHYINPDPAKPVSLQLIRMFLDGEHLAQRAKRRTRHPETHFSDFILHRLNRVSDLAGGIDPELHGLIRRFREETEARASGYRHRVRALCMDMVVAVARKLDSESHPPLASGKPHRKQIVHAAREYIYKHCTKPITLGEIAWHVGKGEEHLARVFKQETGQTVFDYVREARINEARTLLMNPALSMTEIAERCGFNSPAFFSKTFRHYAGMSPTQYRRHTDTIVHPYVE